MGDLNVPIGSENRGREAVLGKLGIGRITENGELFY